MCHIVFNQLGELMLQPRVAEEVFDQGQEVANPPDRTIRQEIIEIPGVDDSGRRSDAIEQTDHIAEVGHRAKPKSKRLYRDDGMNSWAKITTDRMTRDQGPETRDKGTGARDQGPETRDQRSRTSDQGLGTNDQGPI